MEKGKHFLTVECQLINVEEIVELEKQLTSKTVNKSLIRKTSITQVNGVMCLTDSISEIKDFLSHYSNMT